MCKTNGINHLIVSLSYICKYVCVQQNINSKIVFVQVYNNLLGVFYWFRLKGNYTKRFNYVTKPYNYMTFT